MAEVFCAAPTTAFNDDGQKNDLEYFRGKGRTNYELQRDHGEETTKKTRTAGEEVKVCPPGILKLFMRGDLKWEFRSALGLYMRALETYALLRGKPPLSIVLVKAHHACLSHNIPSQASRVAPQIM